MIQDQNGKVPNYVIHKGFLIHQPTGTELFVGLDTSNEQLKVHMETLKQMIKDKQA